jgi:hypothetical protein
MLLRCGCFWRDPFSETQGLSKALAGEMGTRSTLIDHYFRRSAAKGIAQTLISKSGFLYGGPELTPPLSCCHVSIGPLIVTFAGRNLSGQ